jgi:histidinol-phosphate aminotransferase
MHQRAQQVTAERARLRRGLQALDLEVRDSAANFLLIQTGRSAAPALLKKGLVVRTFPATSLLAEYIRVTVRRPEENDRLIAALQAEPRS